MSQMLGVFAEFERGIIRERVNAGLSRAKAKGTKLGRRRISPSGEARILELRANGDGILKIGKTLGIGTSVVQRVFSQNPWKRGLDQSQPDYARCLSNQRCAETCAVHCRRLIASYP